MLRVISHLLFGSSLVCCASLRAPARPHPLASAELAAVDRLAQLLQGTFDSTTQAAEDPNFRSIQLQICEAEAPELGRRVLYVEHSVVGAVDRPYRQRLYVLEPGSEPNQATSRVFELVEPEALVGLCRQKRPVHWNLDRVRELTGCAIALKLKDGRFRGATFGRFCEDKQRRAEYETSEVLLDQAALEKWDRGFDKDGQQVWGSTLGPYRFDRK